MSGQPPPAQRREEPLPCDAISSSSPPPRGRTGREGVPPNADLVLRLLGVQVLQHKGNLTQFSPGRVGAACSIQPCAPGTPTAEAPFQPGGLRGQGVGGNNGGALEASSALCVPQAHPSTERHKSYTIFKLSGPDGTRSDSVTGAQMSV